MGNCVELGACSSNTGKYLFIIRASLGIGSAVSGISLTVSGLRRGRRRLLRRGLLSKTHLLV